MIHTVKGFGIVNKAEIDVFLELSCFFDDPADVTIWFLVPLPFLKPAWTSGSSWFCTYKDVIFIIGDLNAIIRNQEIPGVTGKFYLGIQNEASQMQIEFFQENALIITNTLFKQHKRRLYTWTSPDGQHWNQIDYIICCQRWRSSIQSAKIRPGADCGSDHELLSAKFRLMKKIGKLLDH